MSKKRSGIIGIILAVAAVAAVFYAEQVLRPVYRELNGLMFGMACMGIVSAFPDVYNVIVVLKNANKKDAIVFYKDDMYKVS